VAFAGRIRLANAGSQRRKLPYALPYTVPMRKTSVYLDDELAERLARVAKAEGRPQAEIIREAIAAYEPPPKEDRNLALTGCVTGPGDSVADLDVDELMRGFGE
jgi:hypothetical protein